jgi:hypothetical protein
MFETKSKQPLTFIKLGSPREKDLLRTARQAYDGILITASMIEAFGSSVSSFIRGLDKPFIIDPMVYAFVQPVNNIMAAKDGKIKRSLIEMGVKYGSVVQSEIGKRPLNYRDFQNNTNNVEELTKNVLNYQIERLKGPPSFGDYYGDFEHFLPQVEPEVLIPPYFFFKDTQDPWYGISLEFAKQAFNIKRKGWRIFPVILIPHQLLEKQQEIEAIVSDYTSGNYGGFFVWVNDFKEEEASIKQLQGLIKLVSGLASSRRPVLKLYGGYFSALLWHADLSGFSFGLGYGASKNVFAFGGARGAPNPLYYMPEFHRLLSLPKAEDLIRRYPSLRCNCPTCKTVIGSNPANLSKMKDGNRTAQHFLNARIKEISDLSSTNLTSISTGLEKSVQRFDQQLLSGINIENLRKWQKALSEVKIPIAVT